MYSRMFGLAGRMVVGFAVVSTAACGDETVDVSGSASRVAPAGSQVTFVSNNLPTTLVPGERVNVAITTQNSGSVAWSTATDWGLIPVTYDFGWANDFIDAPVATGASTTHNILVTAPQTSSTFTAQLYSYVSGQNGVVPGGSLSIPVTVSGAASPQWGCTFDSTTLPASMVVGTVSNIDVTVRNTGQQTWPAGGQFCLYAREDADSTSPSITRWGSSICTSLPSSVAPNATHTFTLAVTAPSTPGTYRFMRQMLDTRALDSGGIGFFRTDTFCVDQTITVGAGTPTLGATVISDNMPTTVAPGDVIQVSVVMRNDGTQTWSPGTHFLVSDNTPTNYWGVTAVGVPSTTTTNQQATFTFTVVVPNAPGTSQPFRFRMLSSANGVFGDTLSKTVSISASATPTLGATITANTLPTTMAPSATQSVSVTVRNDGSETWLANGNYSLVSTNSPSNFWGTSSVPVTTSVPNGSSFTFNFTVTSPSQTGTESFRFRMFKAGANTFGPELNASVTISGAVTPPYGATMTSQTIPGSVVAGSTSNTFSITMQNTGSETWPANGAVFLYSNNSPFSVWGATSIPVTSATANGATFTFTFQATAPTTPGTYTSSWRMFQQGGVSYFGSASTTVNVTVTAAPGCGDGSVSGAETCDDGNTTPGDGCSASCTIENRVVDLATSQGNRTFRGFQHNRQLAASHLADLTGDGRADLMMSDFSDVGELGIIRNVAGRVYVYAGGPSFFSGAATAVNAAPLITVWGRQPGDWLGGLLGGVRVGDVTGDGNADLIAGAQFADGTGDVRADSGEVYIFRGGSTLYAGGIFDLADTTVTGTIDATTVLGTVIAGEAAGDRLSVIAVGDVTNDGTADLILGAAYNDSNGADSGEVYVIAGGSGLASTSTVELGSATVAARIVGPGTNGILGIAAAVGDVNGDGINDLAVSAPTFGSNGRSRNGEVYVIFGPVSGTYSTGSAFTGGVRYIGEGNNALYGTDLTIANVSGTATAELIVGAGQGIRTVQEGEVHVWSGPLSSGTIDTAVTGPSSVIFGGFLDYVGGSVEAADVNGDGTRDILFGAGLADGVSNARAQCGEAGIVLGGSALSALVDWSTFDAPFKVIGEASGDILGFVRDSVSAGDIDGDGRADWCVGAHLGGDSAFPNAGRIDCFQSPW